MKNGSHTICHNDRRWGKGSVALIGLMTAAVFAIVLVGVIAPARLMADEPPPQVSNLLRSYAVLGNPTNVAVESPNRIWFAAPGIDAIGVLSITEVSETIIDYSTRYYLTGANSRPFDLALHNGLVWFTMSGTGEIGSLEIASGEVSRYPVAPNSEPWSLAIRPADSTLWFLTRRGNTLGRLDILTKQITEYPYPVANAGLEDLAFNQSQDIWITASNASEVRPFNSTTETFQMAVPAGAAGAPIGIAIDALNLPWVAFSATGDISRYAPGTLVLWRRFAAPISAGQPTGLHVQGDDFSQSIWYTLPAAGAVGYFQTRNSGQLLTPHFNFILPGAHSAPRGITVDGNNVAWIADSGANQIVEWLPPYYQSLFLPTVAKQP